MGLGGRIHFNEQSVGRWLEQGDADIELEVGDGFKFRASLFKDADSWQLQAQITEFNHSVYSNHAKVRKGLDPYLLIDSFWHKLPHNLNSLVKKPTRAEMRKVFKDHVKKRYIKTNLHK